MATILSKQDERPAFLSKEFSRNKVKLVRGGREYFDLLKKLIGQATTSIHLQCYIYDDDETGWEIAEQLCSATRRGVTVYLLVDGYASQSLSSSLIKHLRESGVHFRFFEPLFKSKYFYFGRRMHHKLFVVDGKYGLAGGINISNRYNDWNGEPAWLDFALYAEGPVARELCVLCYKTWRGFPVKMGLTPCETDIPPFDSMPAASSFVRMSRNDWVRRKNEISASYSDMLHRAKKEVIILCSYFLPGSEIQRQLINTSKRGITIKVIVAGRSDVKIAKQAERFIYRDLLEHNIEIYEYQKTILHGKIMVCDGEYVTIGSYNVNNISAYASIELNLDVFDPHFANEVAAMLHTLARYDCIRITRRWLQKKQALLKKFVEWASYESIRLLFYLFTFYFRQHS
jgi:cardiolipin synthase